MNGIAALLFDLDGTIVDTDSLHLSAYDTVLQDYGRSLTLHDYKTRIMGAPNSAIMEFLFPGLPEAEHAALIERKEQAFRGLVRDLEPLPGLRSLLDWAVETAVPVAVVTNAPRPNAELMLSGCGLEGLIPRLIIGYELPRSKPDPMPYEMGLKLTGASAATSVAFEDSLSGIRAASGAGVFTYGVTTGLPRDRLMEAGASDTIVNFTDVHLWRHLQSLLASSSG